VIWNARTYRIEQAEGPGRIALWVGLLGLAASAFGVSADRDQLFYSYLVSLLYWLSLGLGGLFFVMLHHLTGSNWSRVFRRLAENIMMALPVLAILFVPIIFGLHDLYHWADPEVMASDSLLQKKAAFLNPTFFTIRAAGYFAIWTLLAFRLYGASRAEDGGQTEHPARRFTRVSAPGMILFALTITFAAFDWLMSLDAHWYSTIFGAYLFAGAIVAFFGFLIVLVVWIQSRGVMHGLIASGHHHDLGLMLFAFTIFWAYMAFSQYFLIWYANIPEEIIWFLHRWVGSWREMTLLIVFGHFVVPFFILITRVAKRSRSMLAVMAGWMMVMHWVDLHWIAMPTLHHEGISLSWLDGTTFAGIGGIFFWAVWRRILAAPVVALGDPKLEKAIHLHD
jgi:hypothetical protein